ncbi:glycosyltransferase [Pelosinus sp. IPA-1]|uniref:glycosyltransferase n=1 Tax=Pelosinus sp. IPA-1 TaxID=3029569 RepID=UPI0024361587|nr:glycosyltransferase [Pelosinus sp. IPA-1]GMB01266.1 hypothetical protein PIPA1_40650 [Pelosinus sp. IPA-1]
MVLVSVVMPIYNAEKYLSQAIESVLNQTLRDFELILVDDGSKDKSLEICNAYAKQDSRIQVIHQSNGGICAARNCGLEMVKGEYVTFIDNDDVYLPDLLEENYNIAKKYNADILKYGNQYIKHKKFSPAGICSSEKLDEKKLLIIQKEDLREKYKQLNDDDFLVYVWDGLFKTSLLKEQQIKFETSFKHGHEDRVFCMQLYQHINCIIINPKIYYQHIVYKSSTSRIFSVDRIDDTERLLNYERQLFDALRLDDLFPSYWQERVMTYVILTCSIVRSPEAQISFGEIFSIMRRLRGKYYVKAFVGSLGKANYKKRWKNKMYASLFERNYLKVLTNILLVDRKVKYVLSLFS